MSLSQLFSLLENGETPKKQEDLFGFSEEHPRHYEQADIDFITAYFTTGFDSSALNGKARFLFDLSFDAFDNIIHAWMSELPVETEIISFSRRIITSANMENSFEDKRKAAERVLFDRVNEDTLAVWNAADKVHREIHRMMGFLRFNPVNDVYIAKFAPDHFIIPALGEYFTARFGETAWTIIDEKRSFFLSRRPGEPGKLFHNEKVSPADGYAGENDDEWEELWRHYHKTINNESRNNTSLQRQFMPKRYWKYLSEMKN